VDNLQREIASTSDLQTQLTSRVHDLEKENIVLKNRVEESSHKGKVELTNLKMEMLKERGDMERQRDKLINQVEGMILIA
jgi:DNA-binding HxlR family transcriptional regulator